MVKNYLKQFMEWATGSKNNLFFRTRFRLAFFYTIIVAVVMILFSYGLFVSIAKSTKETINDKFKDHALRQVAIEQSREQLRSVLIVGDVIVLVFFGGLAFFLAGRNLRPIEEAMRKQKRFTADASHDLRTPLAIMKTDCEVSLKKNEFSKEEFHELVKSNLEEVNRMSAMVDQLLFLSRNNSVFNQKNETIVLREFALHAVGIFKNLAEKKNISLSLSQSVEGSINVNRLDLEKIFFNLIKNAIDYTLANGKITVSVQRLKDQMVLSIKDTGIGISPDDLPLVTEAFYKADVSRSKENGGSGLGLSIVKKIVEDLNGKLEIQSELGVGTEIRVIFPTSHSH